MRAAEGQRRLNRWFLPYLVLSVSPALTLPISLNILFSLPDCGIDEPWWELRHFEIALLPALADFLPFLWLVSGIARVRQAAVVAGLVGAARYAIPQAATLTYGMSLGGQTLNPECSISSLFVGALLVPLILALWFASALIAAVVLLRSRAHAT